MKNLYKMYGMGNTVNGKAVDLLHGLNTLRTVQPFTVRNGIGRVNEDGLFQALYKMYDGIYQERANEFENWLIGCVKNVNPELPEHIINRTSGNLRWYGPISFLEHLFMPVDNIRALIGTPEYVARYESYRDMGYYSNFEQNSKEFGLEPVTPEGRFSKRFSTWWHKKFGFKLTNEQISQVGNFYNQNYLSDKEYYVLLTNDFSWNDGNFGHSGSCWWDQYSHSRDTLCHYGGYGLLFYRNMSTEHYSNGVGRTWVLPINNDRYVLFNAYGVELKEAASVLARILEEETGVNHTYGRRNLCNDCSDEIPYINNNRCFVVYPSDGEKPEDNITLYLEEQEGYFDEDSTEECDYCGGYFSSDDIHHCDMGNYCNICWDEHVYRCDGCGNECLTDDMLTFADDENSKYCKRCFRNRKSYTCHHCDEAFRYDEHTTDEDGEKYCEDCAYRCLNDCEWCGGSYVSQCECPKAVELRECEEE